MKKIMIVALATLFFLAGCGTKTPPFWRYETVSLDSRIMVYVKAHGLYCVAEETDGGIPYVQVFADRGTPVNFFSVNHYLQDDRQQAEFDVLAASIGDNSYGMKAEDFNYASNIIYYPYSYWLANDIYSMEVVTKQAWDGNHPAGSDIADIAKFLTASQKTYIESGYEERFDWNGFGNEAEKSTYFYRIMTEPEYEKYQTSHPVYKAVSEYGREDFKVIGSGGKPDVYVPLPTYEGSGVSSNYSGYVENYLIGDILFDSLPDEPGTYELSVTFRQDGSPALITGTVEVVFE